MWGVKNSWGEKFNRGAFNKSIQENGPQSTAKYKQKMNAYHNREKGLGVFEVLEDRAEGLYFRLPPLDMSISYMPDVMKQVRSGYLNNFSVEFLPIWEEGKVYFDPVDETIVYNEAKLYGAGLVPQPADMETYLERSVEAIEILDFEIEDFIKEIPRKFELQARQLFARQKSLIDLDQPLLEKAKALTIDKPVNDRDADKLNYLFKNFSL